MMIQSSIITVLLVSTCFQSFSMVQAFDPEDASGFTKPFTDVTGVASTDGSGLLPGGGIQGLAGGIVPDVKTVVGGSLGKRDESTDSGDSQDDGIRKSSGQGVATYSDAPSEEGGLGAIGKDLLAQLKKRYADVDSQDGSQSQESAPKAQGKTSVSLLSLRRRNDLGINRLLGTDQDATLQGESGLVDSLALRRRTLGLLGGGDSGNSDDSAAGGTSVSLVGLRRRHNDVEGGSTSGDYSADQQKSAGGHTKVSLLNLRRRNILPGGLNPKELLGGQSDDATEGSGTSVSLIGKRGNPEPGNAIDMGEPLDRRSTSVLSGTERMDRARQGVVVDSQADRRAVYRRAVYARDNGDDRRIIEDYEKLMQERQEEAYNGQQTPYREQEKKGTTSISLASLRRRLVDGVVQSLTGNLELGGSTSQGDGDLVSDATSVV